MLVTVSKPGFFVFPCAIFVRVEYGTPLVSASSRHWPLTEASRPRISAMDVVCTPPI